jgi:serine/threonine-protein kinase
VFRAHWDDPSGVPVIVKVLRPDAVGTEALVRFQREAQVLRMLSMQTRANPYVVRFYDHAMADIPAPYGGDPLQVPYTVLEYVHGSTLERVLKESGNRGLPLERIRRIVRHIAHALDHVHSQKVVHRDLKPSNILLATEAGTEIAKVTDFGLVKLVDMTVLQRTASLAGASLGYAPPEQYEQGNQRVSPRTDIFSLAAIVFEMLTGKPAFPFREGENPLVIVTRILGGMRPVLSKHRESLAPELAARADVIEAINGLIGKALAADPADRHESASAFLAALEAQLKSVHVDDAASMPPRSVVSPWETTAKADGTVPSRPPPARVNVQRPSAREMLAATPSGPPSQSAPPPAAPPAPPGPRAQPNEAASNPAAWNWTVATRPLAKGTVRAAVFPPGDVDIIAAGPTGFARWARGSWVALPWNRDVDPRLVRTVFMHKTGDVVLGGAGGLVAVVDAKGTSRLLSVPDREVTFLGGRVDAQGTLTMVGERPARAGGPRPNGGNTIGVVAQFVQDRLTLLTDASQVQRLHDVLKMPDGTLVACGDWGVLVRIDLGVADSIGAVCGGHLFRLQLAPHGGAYVIGAGGHALSLSPKLEAQLEAVQTTRDLVSIAIADDGSAWVGSAQARILRRTKTGWLRMSGELGLASDVVALWANATFVRAVCDDGAVIEGRFG